MSGVLLKDVTSPGVGDPVVLDSPRQDFSIQVVIEAASGTALIAWEVSIDGVHWSEVARGQYGSIMLPLRGYPTQMMRGNVLGVSGGASVTAYLVAA